MFCRNCSVFVFVAVDDKTFRIDYLRRDKLTMPDLAVTIPFVIDSETAKANAGGDPLARADLYELIDEARALGVGVSITPAA